MLLPMPEAGVEPSHSGPSAIRAEHQSHPGAEGSQLCVHTHAGKLSNKQAWAHAWLAAITPGYAARGRKNSHVTSSYCMQASAQWGQRCAHLTSSGAVFERLTRCLHAAPEGQQKGRISTGRGDVIPGRTARGGSSAQARSAHTGGLQHREGGALGRSAGASRDVLQTATVSRGTQSSSPARRPLETHRLGGL